MPAPIALFAFSRPDHLHRTLESLAANILASDSDLFVFADAARNRGEERRVNSVRNVARNAKGFKSVFLVEREKNFGLSKNVIDGVTSVCSQFGKVIVLEDDMITSKFFLLYMNEALERFALNERIASIHGYLYPLKIESTEAFFLPGADCWGWATWSRAWKHFNPDGQSLLDELRLRNLIHAFDYNGTYPYSEMLEEQIKGVNDSWAVRWYASTFLKQMLTLYPGRSLVHNIGNDASGTHCNDSSVHDTELSSTPIDLSNIHVTPAASMRRAFEEFFRASHSNILDKILHKIRSSYKRIRNE